MTRLILSEAFVERVWGGTTTARALRMVESTVYAEVCQGRSAVGDRSSYHGGIVRP